MNLLIYILIGGVAGWLAGKIIKGSGYGIIIDILLGLLGGWVGGSIFGWFGIVLGSDDTAYFITAFVGAVLLVLLSRLVKR